MMKILLVAGLIFALLTTARTWAETSVEVHDGEWTVRSNGEVLSGLQLLCNGWNPLDQALPVDGTYQGSKDDLTVTARFQVVQDKWVEVDCSVKNTGDKPVPIRSFEYFHTALADALHGVAAADLRFFGEGQIYGAKREINGTAYYVSALYAPAATHAWIVAYRPPLNWSSRIDKQNDGTLRAEVDFYNRPILLDPGETWTFDPLMLSAEFDAEDGLEAYADFYHPYEPVANAVNDSGFNTWEYYRGEISASILAPQLARLADFNRTGGKVHYFVLDDGWAIDRGLWDFNPKKFPDGGEAWAKQVQAAGFVPGLWLSPFWGNKKQIDENHLTVLDENPANVIRYRLDPSAPEVQENVLGTFRKLHDEGFRYFKIDFLNLAYEGFKKRPFADSKFEPERVVGDFIAKIHQAIGPDSFLLGCATPFAACAERVNAARIHSDITENWGVLTSIYDTVCSQYWTHGHLWINDTDFFVARGPDTLKPGAFVGFGLPKTGPRAYEGFSLIEARTWASIIFASGGLVTFSNQPTGMQDNVYDLLRVLENEGPGVGGRPLDWKTEPYCTKWVKRTDGKLYVILINVAPTARTISVSPQEVPELAGTCSLEEIFTGAKKSAPGGGWTEEVEPHGSRCYRVVAQNS